MSTFTKTLKNLGLCLVACLGFAFLSPAQAQTLSAGDIAFTGFNYDNPDQFSFLALTDIPTGTVINFTDNGWTAAGAFRANEGVWTASFTSDVSCGTEVVITNEGEGISMVVGLGTVGIVIPTSGSLAFSGSGDQILAYQGDASSPSFIAALNSEGSSWQADATSSNTSALPTGLTDGVNAVAVSEVDNATYNCSTSTGTIAEVRTAINTAANWSGSSSTRQTLPAGCEFDLSDCNAGPTCASAGDLIITEIMQNPAAVSDSDGEYFEVYNTTGSAINMNGYTVKDDDSDQFVIDADLIVPAMGFVILGNNNDSGTNGGVNVDYEFSGMFIGNGADEIIIECDEGVIDAVRYDGGSAFPDPNGASMNLDPGSFDATANDSGSNWCESSTSFGDGDFGTPGAANTACGSVACDIANVRLTEMAACVGEDATFQITFDVVGGSGEYEVINMADFSQLGSFLFAGANGTFFINCTLDGPTAGGSIMVQVRDLDGGLECESDPFQVAIPECFALVCPNPGDLVITEIMNNPSAVGDSNGEYFEIFNNTGSDINLKGFIIRDNDFDTHTIAADVIAPANGYVVLGVNTDMATNGGVPVAYDYGGNWFLSNSSDEVVIECSGTVIDEVEYDNGFTFPDPNGTSMSLNPSFTDAFNNNFGENWCTSTSMLSGGDMGTPGAANDLCCGAGPILPPYTNHDIGAANGSASFDPCTDMFMVTSAGYAAPPTSDVQHVVSQFICGNGSITARVKDVTNAGWGGIFIRENDESNNPNAKKVELRTQGGNFVQRTVRTTTGGFAFPQQLFRPMAKWLRIERSGNGFTGYTSINGINWQFAFFANVAMSSCVEVGIFASGINPLLPATATFDNVSITNGFGGPTLVEEDTDMIEGFNLENERANQNIDLSIYPNPATDEVFVKGGAMDKATTISVINSLGQVVDQYSFNTIDADGQRLSLENYEDGLYLIYIETEGQPAISKKLVIQKQKGAQSRF